MLPIDPERRQNTVIKTDLIGVMRRNQPGKQHWNQQEQNQYERRSGYGPAPDQSRQTAPSRGGGGGISRRLGYSCDSVGLRIIRLFSVQCSPSYADIQQQVDDDVQRAQYQRSRRQYGEEIRVRHPQAYGPRLSRQCGWDVHWDPSETAYVRVSEYAPRQDQPYQQVSHDQREMSVMRRCHPVRGAPPCSPPIQT